ncbi:hypothetical protein CTEN210_18213 [Chaetoceros tenuissimus]|uniref:Ubiquitin-like domain-containing protein n=1 Tax=Chaetoceros tenuissimus TaxID=426638 RepID=A0AAD3DC15_9STRA|nr:hypothetical protein CTEN210_18213 [Chaetoceros tenuissimus]
MKLQLVNFEFRCQNEVKWEEAIKLLFSNILIYRFPRKQQDLILCGEIDLWSFCDPSNFGLICELEKETRRLRQEYEEDWDESNVAYDQRCIAAVVAENLSSNFAHRSWFSKFVAKAKEEKIFRSNFQERFDLFREMNELDLGALKVPWNAESEKDVQSELNSLRPSNFVPRWNDRRVSCHNYIDFCSKIENLQQCSRCKIVEYCSAECQQKDWPEHRPICKKLAGLRKDKAKLIEIAKSKGKIEPKICTKDIFLLSGEDDDDSSQDSIPSLDSFADRDPEEVELVMNYAGCSSRNKAKDLLRVHNYDFIETMRKISDIDLLHNKVENLKSTAICSNAYAVQALLNTNGDAEQGFRDVYRKLPVEHMQKWLMKLKHAVKCSYEDCQCPNYLDCATLKQLLKHMSNCSVRYCKYDSCWKSREILKYYCEFYETTRTAEEQHFVTEAAERIAEEELAERVAKGVQISIGFRGQPEERLYFRVQKNEKDIASKLLSMYAEKKEIDPEKLRLTYHRKDGVIFNHPDIINRSMVELGVENLDHFFVDKILNIGILDQSGEETVFRIKQSTNMSNVFAAYAQRKKLDPKTLRFLLDGQRIAENETPITLELEDEDRIDCLFF